MMGREVVKVVTCRNVLAQFAQSWIGFIHAGMWLRGRKAPQAPWLHRVPANDSASFHVVWRLIIARYFMIFPCMFSPRVPVSRSPRR